MHLPECSGLGEMPGSVPETLTSICNKTHMRMRKSNRGGRREEENTRGWILPHGRTRGASLSDHSLFSTEMRKYD